MLKNIVIILILMTVTSGLYAQNIYRAIRERLPLPPLTEENRKKIDEYRQKLSSNPNDIELHRAYQNFMRQWDGLNDLKEEYLLKMNAEPQNPLYYYLYGRLTKGRELEDTFKRALDLEAKTPNPELRFWLYFGFGQFYLDTKKYKEALQHLEMASKLRPDSLDALHQTALVHYEMDNITEAMNLWDKILQSKKDYFDAMLGKALIYKSRGMYDNAIKELESILKSDVAFWRAYEPLIQCYHAKKDYKKGEELRTKVKELCRGINDTDFKMHYQIVIDIINIKPKIIVVKEKINPLMESGYVSADYLFGIYQNGIDKVPEVIYEIFSFHKDPLKETKTFRLYKRKIFAEEEDQELVKEYTIMPSYPDLLNEILARETGK